MNKFGWMLLGAGAVVAVGAVAGSVGIFEAAKHVQYVSDHSGDYTLRLAVSPGRQPKGYGQMATVQLLQNGKPMADARVTLKIKSQSGSHTETLTTDKDGLATAELISFTAQTMTVTAVYKTSGGSTVTASATPMWCNCGARTR